MKLPLAQKILYIILGLIVISFYYIHFVNSYNFPIHDEFRTISTVVLDFVNASGFWNKTKVFLVNENESLQLMLKLFNVGFYSIFGEIRYDLLGYIGQLSLLSFPIVMYKVNKDNETRWFDIALTVLVVFNLQYYVLSLRHDTSFYYHVGLLGTIFSAYFWVKNRYGLAAAFFLIGIFNNTSSLLILPVFLVDRVFNVGKVNRNYIFGGIAGFILVLTFFYLINPGLFNLLEGPEITIRTFFIIMGNYVEYYYSFLSETPYYYYGTLLLLVFLFTLIYYLFFYKEKTERDRFYAVMAMYLFISIVVLGLKRSILYHHLNNLLDPRYKMFTFPLILFLILLWDQMFTIIKPWLKWSLIGFFFLYNIIYIFDSQEHVRYYKVGPMVNSLTLSEGYDVLGPTHINFATRVYNRLDSLGIVRQPDEEIVAFQEYLKNTDLTYSETIEAELAYDRYLDLGNYHSVLELWVNERNRNTLIFLKSDEDVLLHPIYYYYKNSRGTFLRTFKYYSDKFYLKMFLSTLKEGEYSLGIISKEKNGEFVVKNIKERVIIDSKVTNMRDEYPE